MHFLTMESVDLKNKRVLVRSDLNVPLKEGRITNEERLLAALPTFEQAFKQGAASVTVMSHLGRPQAGKYQPEFSLLPVVEALKQYMAYPVFLVRDWMDPAFIPKKGGVNVLENVRFQEGELSNDAVLAQKMAHLGDVFVMDAFGTAHRAHASTCGVGFAAPLVCAGPLLVREVETLHRILQNTGKSTVTIVGGSKLSTKLSVLKSLSDIAWKLIPGGGIANTFLAAKGFSVGRSLVERDFIQEAAELLRSGKVVLPVDVMVADTLSEDAQCIVKPVKEVPEDKMIVDIGPQTMREFDKIVVEADTILWNGPIGVFEIDKFGLGTQALAESVARSPAFSVVGGGDTLAAIAKYGARDAISYLSTGGGAFLEYIEGKELPALSMLAAQVVSQKGM